jgi:hypothetical protein
VVDCGEVMVVLIFNLVDVAKALVQLERLSVASWKTSAQSRYWRLKKYSLHASFIFCWAPFLCLAEVV